MKEEKEIPTVASVLKNINANTEQEVVNLIKLHVKAALVQANNSATIVELPHGITVDSASILNSYPE